MTRGRAALTGCAGRPMIGHESEVGHDRSEQ
jgi:hypothetical protein